MVEHQSANLSPARFTIDPYIASPIDTMKRGMSKSLISYAYRLAVGLVCAIMLVSCGSSADDPHLDETDVYTPWVPFNAQAALPPTSSEVVIPLLGMQFGILDPHGAAVEADYFLVGASTIECAPHSLPPQNPTSLATDYTLIHEFVVYNRSTDDRLLLGIVGDVEIVGVIQGRLEYYRDANDDGHFTANELVATIEDPSPPAGGARWTSVAPTISGECYVFDTRNYEIRRVTDRNGDRVPDALSATVFLDSTKTHELKETRVIEFNTADKCLCLYRDDPAMVGTVFEDLRVRDTDGDGRADEQQTVRNDVLESDEASPYFIWPALVGETTIRIVGPPSTSFELWSMNAQGDKITNLASDSHVAGQTESTLKSSTPFQFGQTLALCISGSKDIQDRIDVKPRGVSITSISPRAVSRAAGAVVSLEGFKFDTTVNVAVLFPFDSSHPDSGEARDYVLTVHSPTRATFTIPPMPGVPVGRADLILNRAGGEAEALVRLEIID